MNIYAWQVMSKNVEVEKNKSGRSWGKSSNRILVPVTNPVTEQLKNHPWLQVISSHLRSTGRQFIHTL